MVKAEIRKTNYGYDRMYLLDHADDTAVCNYISGISYTIAAAILNLIPDDKIITKINASGHFDYEIVPNKDYDIIFEIAYIGLKQLETKYPQDIVVKLFEI